jgi:hypothetical protein
MSYHQESLTQRSTALSEDLIGTQWDNVTKRKDKRVNIFHVQIVRRNGV